MIGLKWLRLQLFICMATATWFSLIASIDPHSDVTRVVTGSSIGAASAFAAVCCCRTWRAWRAAGRHASYAWLLFTVAGATACVLCLDIVIRRPGAATARVSDGGRMLVSAAIACGLLFFVLEPETANRRIRSAVDAGLAVMAVILIGWIWPVEDLMDHASRVGGGGGSLAALPVLDLVGLGLAALTVGSISLAAHHGHARPLARSGALVLLASVACGCASDTALAYLGTPHGQPSWGAALELLTWLFLGVAARGATRNQVAVAATDETAITHAGTRPTMVALAPQALLALPLLAAAGWLAAGNPLPVLPTGCLLAVVALLGIRQALVQRDNISLNRNLEDRVAARTEDVSSSERRFRSLVAHNSDAMLLLDRDFVVTWASPSIRSVFALEPSEVVGASVTNLLRLAETAPILEALTDVTERPYASQRLSFAVLSGLGRWHDTETVATSLLDDPDVGGLVLNMRDVSERQELEQQLLHQAFHDALTRLANRARFLERVTEALEQAAVTTTPCAVLLLDLDGFKAVNDSLGHDTGDNLLVAVANRLVATVDDGGTVARLGGDEFAILTRGLTEASQAVELAARVVAVLDRPVAIGERQLPVRCSVGVAWVDPSTGPVPTTEDLLRNADLAMYRAKANGGGLALFEPSMHALLLARVQEEADLRGALERGELHVAYQPAVDLSDGRIVGVEALLRWDHPTRGPVSPEQFIPTAENTGVIVPIGEWVLEQACRQVQAWSDVGLTVAVNVSALQLQRSDFAATVRQVLIRTGLHPARLTLELTESVLLDGPEQTVSQLREIRSHGTRVAIDDFGTGYSSLSYLTRFPVDVLKIDRSFVERLDSGPSHDSLLVRTIVQLGRSLELVTLAEGIETQDQLDALRAMGCSHGQGFLFARALTPEALTALLHPETAAVPLGSSPLGSSPLGSLPLGSLPLGSLPLGSSPLGSVPPGTDGPDRTGTLVALSPVQ